MLRYIQSNLLALSLTLSQQHLKYSYIHRLDCCIHQQHNPYHFACADYKGHPEFYDMLDAATLPPSAFVSLEQPAISHRTNMWLGKACSPQILLATAHVELGYTTCASAEARLVCMSNQATLFVRVLRRVCYACSRLRHQTAMRFCAAPVPFRA